MSTPKLFAPFRLDPANQSLWRQQARISMAPKVFDVLRHLVENAGRLVTQQELLDAVWPQTFVQPEILRKYILEIRKALGDPPNHPVFIETLPKRGYRFIAPVIDETPATPKAAPSQSATRLVGREAPLAELTQCLNTALTGQRKFVFVTGEGGIGKTTLLDAFEQESLRAAGVRSVRGQCVEGFGGKESYYPVLEAFGQLLAGPGGEPILRTLAAHAPTWLVQFPAAIRAEQRQSLQQEILGATRERMVREICEALERLSADQPLALILEDLQWVDDSTLDLISALARRRSPARLMLVATYRPVDVILSSSPLRQLKQDLLVHRLCHEMSVEPLTESQVEHYLAAEFPDTSLPRLLAGTIHRRSDGNPMFMIAMVDQMRQKGLLAAADGRWTLTVPANRLDPGVPQTLQQLIEIQIERLGPGRARPARGGERRRSAIFRLGGGRHARARRGRTRTGLRKPDRPPAVSQARGSPGAGGRLGIRAIRIQACSLSGGLVCAAAGQPAPASARQPGRKHGGSGILRRTGSRFRAGSAF